MRIDALWVLLVAYAAASLFHHVHNAVFLDAYPNMPAWISPVRVYAAWLLESATGIVGYLLIRRGHRRVGLALVAVYGAFGLDGLAHYGLAPFSSHSFTMNLTIGLEVATATILLMAVARLTRLQ